jgi:Na+/H+-dicarboxylate symporter
VSLATRILIGLLLGVFAGLLVGEMAAPLEVLGDAFVGLLQMTVLPYIVVALIANVGRLSLERGWALIGRAAIVWAVLLLIGGVVLVAMSMAFPGRSMPSFFSAPEIHAPRSVDLFTLFVPINVFQSLVTNAVPGVVLFCICVGAALIGIPNKQGVIDGLDAVGEAISRVNGFVVRLTPYGVFAIGAAAAGTMTLEEFGRMRGYILVFALTSAILAFWVLPALVAACTPFRYRDVVRASRDALFTAFATGKVLVVLPMLIESTKKLFEETELRDPEIDPSVDVLYPLIYPFPYLGKLLALLFVPFAAAFVGRSLELTDYPSLIGLGTVSLFGGPILAIPFLLEASELPSDMFQLFLLSGVLTSRFGDMAGVVNLFAFTVITTCLLTGSFRARWGMLGWIAVASVAIVGLGSGVSRAWLEGAKDEFRRDKIIGAMHPLDRSRMVEAVVLDEASPNPVGLRPGQSRLDRIRERGVLRVGFNDDNLPYAFRNARGELVGFDIEMAHALARDLGVTLEFVPFERSTLAEQFASDHFDLAMSGLIGTVERSKRMRLSQPYLEATLGFVVRDHRARDLDTYQEVVSQESFRVGILSESQFSTAVRWHVSNAETQVVPSASWFFEEEHELDALLISAEAGAALTMLHPHFQVVVPTRRRVEMPLVYPMPFEDEQLSEFVDFWISVQDGIGRIADLSDYWIRGKGTQPHRPRWSILRDVLGWVD